MKPRTPSQAQQEENNNDNNNASSSDSSSSGNSNHDTHNRKSWFDRHTHHNSDVPSSSSLSHEHGKNKSKFHIFGGKHHHKKRLPHSEAEAESTPDAREEEEYHIPPTPGIEIWEEENNIIIEDSCDDTPQIVINKNQQPNWRDIVKRTVAEKRRIIQGESPSAGTGPSDESFASTYTATSSTSMTNNNNNTSGPPNMNRP